MPMTPPFDGLSEAIMSLVLVIARFSGFFAVSPFFSRRAMPRLVLLGITMALSLLATPQVAEAVAAEERLRATYMLLIVKEMALGYFLGVLVWLPLRRLELAGVILDTQCGTTQAQDLDVVSGAQTTPTGILLSQIFAGYFFATGSFLLVVKVLFESLSFWPPAQLLPGISQEVVPLFIRFVGAIFLAAVSIALPVSGFMLLADIIIAFLARSAQSLNALTFAMPVKIALMLVVLIFYLGIIYPKIVKTFGEGLGFMSGALTP